MDRERERERERAREKERTNIVYSIIYYALRSRDGSSSKVHSRTRHEEPMEVNKFVGKCYNCGNRGHRANESKKPKIIQFEKSSRN